MSHEADVVLCRRDWVELLWPHVRRGLAFNVMSKVVDWEREDLFHLPMDDSACLLHRLAGRRVYARRLWTLRVYGLCLSR